MVMKITMRQHDSICDAIMQQPRIVGLENVVESYREYPIRNGSHDLLTEIDYLAITGYGDATLVEVKCHDRKKLRHKAKEQLWIGREGVRRIFNPRSIQLLYVHDDFQIEQLNPSGEFNSVYIHCICHFLGYNTNSLAIGNKCLGCKPDRDMSHHPNNLDCEQYEPVRVMGV